GQAAKSHLQTQINLVVGMR
ncbi:unnamed protein product, partial [Allacma fusca]